MYPGGSHELAAPAAVPSDTDGKSAPRPNSHVREKFVGAKKGLTKPTY